MKSINLSVILSLLWLYLLFQSCSNPEKSEVSLRLNYSICLEDEKPICDSTIHFQIYIDSKLAIEENKPITATIFLSHFFVEKGKHNFQIKYCNREINDTINIEFEKNNIWYERWKNGKYVFMATPAN